MNENIDRLIKPAVLCFIFLILTVFLLTAIFYDYDEMVYAGEIETIQDFIGQPAAAVVENYGFPKEAESERIRDGCGCYEELWHYDNVTFTIRFEDYVHVKGTVVGVETAFGGMGS